jgi:hypothetical protein
MISVSCVPFRGTRGYATLMVDPRGEELALDAQISGGCMIILNETSAAALFCVLAAWLAGLGAPQGVRVA